MNFPKLRNLEFLYDQLFRRWELRPHKFGKSLAKIIIFSVMISHFHVKNSGDLLNKIDNINIEGIYLTSLHIKSSYTNIPVKKYVKHLEIQVKKISIILTDFFQC